MTLQKLLSENQVIQLAHWEGDGPPPHCDGLCPVLSPLLPMADVVTHSSPGLHQGAEDQGGTRWALP